MIKIKDRFEISDNEYNYAVGYYTANKWIDNSAFVAARSKNERIASSKAEVELVKISLETGEKTVLCNDAIGNTSYVVHQNFVYYANANGKQVKEIDTNTGEITVIYEDEFYPDDQSIKISMPEKTNDGKFLSIFYNIKGKETLFAVIDVEKRTAKKLCEKVFSEPFSVANHGMICPSDPRIIFFAHEGDTRYVSNRLWIYDDRTGQMYNLAKQNLDINGNLGDCFGHESWAPDGKGMYFVKYPVSPVPPRGICYVDLNTRETKLLYSAFPYWHVGVSPDGRFLLADTVIDYTESDVIVIDQNDKTETFIDNVKVDTHPRHPHPQMSPDNKTVLYTAIDENGMTVIKGAKLELI